MKMQMKGKIATALTALSLLTIGQASAATYTVQPGDYLWKIAAENGITVAQLSGMNNLNSSSLTPGQILQVPDPQNAYTVQYGDTLWKIAQKFGMEMPRLIAANPQMKDPNNIWQGMQLSIPQKPPAYANGVFPLAKGTYSPFTNDYADGRGWTPQGQTARKHEGVDIFAEKGTPVYSAMDGKVIRYGWNEYGGWRLTIQTDASFGFYYAHLSKYAPGIGLGSIVKKGQLIGYVGNTGYGPAGTEGAFLPHLHFGMYKLSDWTTTDPYMYLRWWSIAP